MDLRKLCRICLLDNASVDITEQKANVWTTEGTEYYTILKIILEMFDKHICLDLVNELPMICIECQDNCLENYRLFMKLKMANLQLRELYESKKYELQDLHVDKDKEHQDIIGPIDNEELFVMEIPEDIANSDHEKTLQNVPESLSNQDSLIVSDFLPVNDMESDPVHSYPTVHTIDYAAVELNRDNLEEYIKANRLPNDTMEPNGTSVYKCKFCPMAYASSEFLKTHIRKTHVCKYCTMAFVKIKDLNAHIRNNHSNHSCVVCKKVLSSSSNLRAHIKHLHGIKLPAQVALLDFRPANQSDSFE